MSWLFGIGGKPPPPIPPKTTEDNVEKKESIGVKSGGYSFDSTALERAAQAAEKLEKSKYSREAFELSKSQEVTEQLNAQTKIKDYELNIERMKVEQVRVAQEERRKTLQEESQQQKQRADYQDMLARKRQQDQLSLEKRNQEEILHRQEESLAKQESMKRATIEYQEELRHKNDLKRIEAELRGKASVDRENRDIYAEQLRIKAQEKRETTLQSIREFGKVFGTGFTAFVSDPTKMTRTVGALTFLAVGIYSAKFGIGTTARFIESRIGKPSLVRETSRINIIDLIRSPIKTSKRIFNKPEDALKGIILSPPLEARLRELAIATRHTKSNGGFYRNVLMWGAPGTGKTMFAKSLALHSGMDYAIMTGGDVAPMGSTGVSAVHRVFDWANTSRKGILLFVDEADAFLRKRSQERISEDMRATLNAFLYRTGEQSKRFMLVLASNQPEQFDWAITDRLDEMVEFPIPTLAERQRLVRHYFDLYVLQPMASKKFRIRIPQDMDYAAICSNIADRTDGLSGREISKIAVAWQTSAFASEDGVLTSKIIEEKVQSAIDSHAKKQVWQATLLPGTDPQSIESPIKKVFKPKLAMP